MQDVNLKGKIDRCPWPRCKHKPKGPNNKNWRSHLRRHIRTHQRGKKLPCLVPECLATFSAGRHDNLRAHLCRVHKWEKNQAMEAVENNTPSFQELSWPSQGVTTGLGHWTKDEHSQEVDQGLIGQDATLIGDQESDLGISLLQTAFGPTVFGGVDAGFDYLDVPIERPSNIGPVGWNS
ncbi:hypothetical protein M406DRAFT_358443 [Cryphonectria parasitica EP155]|uniref:C2H2-type domain-containing protein n=1 Tax=Cryphonectria parasitica (strain ATCC 38755 / EP155) TaxID=660469 RepID=A0A9P5CKP7_CRYP1|nr:uncharacterized protein M406DRAFT_358443 [Cryphonectria parasitica EP155]KAF3761000.1 hypothetical protein M406DRAFT_358443 [Cryphonectria parasitica EP155]